VKQPAIDLQVIKVQSRFVPMGRLSPRAPMALFKRGGGSHICEQVAQKKRVSQIQNVTLFSHLSEDTSECLQKDETFVVENEIYPNDVFICLFSEELAKLNQVW